MRSCSKFSTSIPFYLFFVLLTAGANFLYADTITTVLANGDPANRVDIVILGEGYTEAEMTLFSADVENIIEGIFDEQPFSEYRSYFNVHQVEVASEDSGVDHPEQGIFKNTAFDARYNCAGIVRLICVDTQKVYAALADLAFVQRDIIIVLVNDSSYGGAGGAVAVASTHRDVVNLILHELGHSFGGLADEYVDTNLPCNNTREPPEPNVTLQTDRSAIKWNKGGGFPTGWIDHSEALPSQGTASFVPGLYEGALYCEQGLYRPTYNSKMRSLSAPFEQINEEQLIKRIYNLVSPLDASWPTDSDLSVQNGETLLFGVDIPNPRSAPLTVTWYVNDEIIANGLDFSLDTLGLGIGQHQIKVIVHDETNRVRSDPDKVLQDSRIWNLELTVANIDLTLGGEPPLSVFEDNLYDFTPSVTANMDAQLTFSIENKPAWASFNTASGRLTGTPTNDDVGIYRGIIVSVDDGSSSALLPSFSLEVINTNDPPTLTGNPATTVEEDSPYYFEPTASDVDIGDHLVFSIENKPDWINFDSTNGSLSGLPINDNVGIYRDIAIHVTDGQEVVALPSFDLTVINTNDPAQISGTPANIAPEDSHYSFIPIASDIDIGDRLRFSIENRPRWAGFDTLTGALSGTPVNDDVGNYNNIVIGVSDGTQTVFLPPFDITVTNTNDPPTIAGEPVLDVLQNELYRFSVNANDVDLGTQLQFLITNKPAWLSFDNTQGILTGTPSNADVGVFRNITISVSDGLATATLPSFDISVANVNDAPVARDDEFIIEEGEAILTASVLLNDSDPDNDTLSILRADTVSLEGGSVRHLGEGRFSYTPPESYVGQDSFVYVITDSQGETDQARVNLFVNASTNAAPGGGNTPSPTDVDENASPNGGPGSISFMVLMLLVCLIYKQWKNHHFLQQKLPFHYSQSRLP